MIVIPNLKSQHAFLQYIHWKLVVYSTLNSKPLLQRFRRKP